MKKKLATVMAATMAVSGSVVSVNASTTNEQLIGSNRTDTAVKISKDGWYSADTVILVNDAAIPDALTATPLAHAKNAPILLTGKGGLNKATANEIKRLGAKDVIMIGGDAVLPAKIENDLKALNIKADRVKGSTREETALAIAKRLDGIKDVSEIAVVNSTTGLADAVSVAAAAAEKGMPIILANPKKGLSAAEKFIKDEAIKASFIIGGKTALPEKLVESLPSKQRIEGSNRNDTNAKVIEKFYGDKELDNLYLAKDGRGGDTQLIDALAVGALAAKNGAPVLIASKKLSANQVNVINTKKIDTITQVGGKGNEGAFSHLKDIEKAETIKVKNEAELQEALKKANANDTIEIDANATISKDLTLSTNNAIQINVKGDLTGKVTVKTPNADIKNSGTIGTLVVENGKNTTVTNTSAGKIDKVEVDSSSSNVKVENNGKIDKVENNASGTSIENNGTISKPIEGTNKPSVEGNKPGGGTTGPETGGGGSVSDTTAPGIAEGRSVTVGFTTAEGVNVVPNGTVEFNDGDTVENIKIKMNETVKIVGNVNVKHGEGEFGTVKVDTDGKTLVITPNDESKKVSDKKYDLKIASDSSNYIADTSGNKLAIDTGIELTFVKAEKVVIVNNETEITNNLSNKKIIKLGKDIEITNGISVPVVEGGKILDLNGYTITNNKETGSRGILVETSNVKLDLKNGSISIPNGKDNGQNIAVFVRNEKTNNVVVNMSDIKIKMGGFKNPSAAECSFENIYGVYVNGNCKNISMNMNKCEINGAVIGVYFPAEGTINISDSEITGGTAVGIKGGSGTIKGSTLKGTKKSSEEELEKLEPAGGGISDLGEALYIEGNYGDREVNMTVEDSTLISDNGYAIRMQFFKDDTKKKKLTVKSGTISGALGSVFTKLRYAEVHNKENTVIDKYQKNEEMASFNNSFINEGGTFTPEFTKPTVEHN